MYEELMSKYRGVKYLLSFPVGPIVTAYFKNVLKKHLDAIQPVEINKGFKIVDAVDHSAQSSNFHSMRFVNNSSHSLAPEAWQRVYNKCNHFISGNVDLKSPSISE
jgi:hypothetical protein